MGSTRRRAAQLRGCFVGAIAAASAIAGHALGGAAVPGGTAIVLVVLCSAGVGAVASAATVDAAHRVVAVLAYVTLGQFVGHYVLAFASLAGCSGGHQHGHGWTATMASAHASAAVAAAVLICAAERTFAALAAVVWQLVVVLLMPGDPEPSRPSSGSWWTEVRTLRGGVACGSATRAPPALLAA